jgi:hypothetical protein
MLWPTRPITGRRLDEGTDDLILLPPGGTQLLPLASAPPAASAPTCVQGARGAISGSRTTPFRPGVPLTVGTAHRMEWPRSSRTLHTSRQPAPDRAWSARGSSRRAADSGGCLTDEPAFGASWMRWDVDRRRIRWSRWPLLLSHLPQSRARGICDSSRYGGRMQRFRQAPPATGRGAMSGTGPGARGTAPPGSSAARRRSRSR